MRLFVAIDFERNILGALDRAITGLKRVSERGRFSRRENLHMTLAFIGEVAPERLGEARDALMEVEAPAFQLTLTGPGRFAREDGDVYWVGVKRCPELTALAEQVTAKLREHGFELEERQFTPHITIARGVATLTDTVWLDMPQASMRVGEIGLYRSERPAGRLTYNRLAVKALK